MPFFLPSHPSLMSESELILALGKNKKTECSQRGFCSCLLSTCHFKRGRFKEDQLELAGVTRMGMRGVCDGTPIG